MKIVVSAGSYKFHMAPLAAELGKAGFLSSFITAGWPIGWQKFVANLFPRSPGCQRFLDRYEAIPEQLVFSQPQTEFLLKIGDIFFRKFSQRWQQKIHRIAFWLYARGCRKVLVREAPDVYHYRNCYGLGSVDVSRKLNIVSLCDHSIAHPICLAWMESHSGAWPSQHEFIGIQNSLMPLYKQMEGDLCKADHLLVNSDFVKATCVHAGMDPARIHVVYLGVDDAFFETLARPATSKTSSRISLLYAGGWQRRKGVSDIVEALALCKSDWSLEIAGGMEPELKNSSVMKEFLSDTRVKYHGILPREKLGRLMQKHRIFLFPSYCEGSARVIFEAMAAGCFVITTPNSGSIIEDGVHGRLIAAGDIPAFSRAIQEAIENPEWVEDIGKRNAHLVESNYRQNNYASGVRSVYESILSQSIA